MSRLSGFGPAPAGFESKQQRSTLTGFGPAPPEPAEEAAVAPVPTPDSPGAADDLQPVDPNRGPGRPREKQTAYSQQELVDIHAQALAEGDDEKAARVEDVQGIRKEEGIPGEDPRMAKERKVRESLKGSTVDWDGKQIPIENIFKVADQHGVDPATIMRMGTGAGQFENRLAKTVVGQTLLRAEAGLSDMANTVLSLGARAVGSDATVQNLKRSQALRQEYLSLVEKGSDLESVIGETGNRIYGGVVQSLAKVAATGALGAAAGATSTAPILSGLAAENMDTGLNEADDLGLEGSQRTMFAVKKAAIETGITYLMGSVGKKLGIGSVEEMLSPGMRQASANLLNKSGVLGKLAKFAGAAGSAGMEAGEEMLVDAVTQLSKINEVGGSVDFNAILESGIAGAAGGAGVNIAQGAMASMGQTLGRKLSTTNVQETVKGVVAAEAAIQTSQNTQEAEGDVVASAAVAEIAAGAQRAQKALNLRTPEILEQLSTPLTAKEFSKLTGLKQTSKAFRESFASTVKVYSPDSQIFQPPTEAAAPQTNEAAEHTAREIKTVQDAMEHTKTRRAELVAQQETEAAAPTDTDQEGFNTGFAAAFDKSPGAKDNLVTLLDLRKQFPELSTKEFNAKLRDMRVKRHVELSGAENRTDLSQEQRDAGIKEGPKGDGITNQHNLIYAAISKEGRAALSGKKKTKTKKSTTVNPEIAALDAELAQMQTELDGLNTPPEAAPVKTAAETAQGVPAAPETVIEMADTTSAQREDVDSYREELDLPAIPDATSREFEQELQDAKDAGVKENALTLAQEVMDKPRAFTPVETAGLVMKAADLRRAYTVNDARLMEATKSGDTVVAEQAGLALETNQIEFDLLTAALRKSGTEKGRALASQKLRIDANYDLISVTARAKVANGSKDLSSHTDRKIRDLVKRLATQQAATAKLDEGSNQHQDSLIGERNLRVKINEAVARVRARRTGGNWEPLWRLSKQMRNSMATGEFSGILRQGGFAAVGHPIDTMNKLPVMWKAFRNRVDGDKAFEAIEERPLAKYYERTGLFLHDPKDEGSPNRKEEQMAVNAFEDWSESMSPGLHRDLMAGIGSYTGSTDLAFTTHINEIRADRFDALVGGLSKNGQANQAQMEAIASFVNTTSGRGGWARFERSLDTMGSLFFAPRFAISRIQTLFATPLFQTMTSDSKLRGEDSASLKARNDVQLAIAGEYARSALGVASVVSLALGAFPDDMVKFTLDPRDPDFGKIVAGNTRIDVMFGLVQPARLAGQLLMGEKFSGGRAQKVNGGREILNFLRKKSAPGVGMAFDMLAGDDAIGRKIDRADPLQLGQMALSRFTPLALADILGQAFETPEDFETKAAVLSWLNVLGAGVQTYDSTVNKK